MPKLEGLYLDRTDIRLVNRVRERRLIAAGRRRR
jgi:hypothetical protein